MSKVITVNLNELQTIKGILYVASQVNLHTDEFLNEIYMYGSHELAAIEMCISVANGLQTMTHERHSKVVRAITHERNVVRGEDR